MTEQSSEPAAATTGKRSRRTAIIAVVSLVVVAVLGAGTFAAFKLISSGPQPDTALPASTVGFVSVDLDPSAKQKIEAIKTLRKFPDLRKQVDLNTSDDLRKYIFDEAIKQAGCTSMTFDKDIRPWVRDRAALGAVDLGGKSPAPVAAVQFSDGGKAKAAIDKLIACSGVDDIGYALGDHYAIISDTSAHAKTIVADGKAHPLADDAAYQKWSGEVGDKGVVNFYVAKQAAAYGTDQVTKNFGDSLGSMQSVLDSFTGMAGTVRFGDGGVEVAMSAGGVDQFAGTTKVGAEVERLPTDTALVAALGVPADYAKTLVDQFTKAVGGDAQDLISQAETQTGMSLPEDLQTLLGKAIVISVGGDAPSNLNDVGEPSDIPAAVSVTGDAGSIQAVVRKIEERVGTTLKALGVVEGKDSERYTVATSDGYASSVLKGGTLGDDSTFKDVVPDADQAAAIVFVRLDSAWREAAVAMTRDLAGAKEADSVDADTAPLEGFGVSTWRDGKVSHVLVKLTTK